MNNRVHRGCVFTVAIVAMTVPFLRVSGQMPVRAPRYAITNARIVTAAGPVIEKGTVVMREGIIEDVGAAVPDMGNHLIDSKSPELVTAGTVFTHTFIFGAYDGHVIFYEPMITQAFLESRPDLCAPIKQPQAWEIEGYYPTTYCIRHLPDEGRFTVSLEDFVHRAAN